MAATTKAIQFDTQTASNRRRLWAGRVISALPALFLLIDGIMKLVKPPIVVETTVKLGYSESLIAGLGVVLLACTIIYLIPRTAMLGAILLTGYLGGAVATHVRVGDPLFTIIFPVILGAMLWGGLYLRDVRMRLA
ncbi:MAG TPA: DoxX family protein [Pyrinomonadaceae bacterium]|nr:DoxX family protein [Pyrinomonadaceae bacterium]